MDDLDIGESETSLILQLSDAAGQKTRSMSQAQRTVFKALQIAIDEAGVSAPSDRVPRKATTMDMWKRYAYNMTITNSESEDAKRKAFTRSAKALLDGGFIGKWREFAWTNGQNADGQVVQAENGRKQGVTE